MSEEKDIINALTNVAQGNFEFETVEMEFEKKSLEEIHELAKNVDTTKASEEVLQWLTENVAHFIDNKEKEFRIDLVIEENSGEKMENIKLLQDLYRAIPDDSDYVDAEKVAELMANGSLDDIFEDEDFKNLVECREVLDGLSFEVHDKMRESKKLKDLYKAMIYYYEMIGINAGLPLLQDLNGEVDIVEFEYESFNVAVTTVEGVVDATDETATAKDKKVVQQYTIPEGFTMVVEIAFMDQSRTLGLF
jgi:hypothetical protein